jgi:TatD DNase family protein
MMDIHTHLYWKSYDADRDAVIGRARDAGVKELFVIGCTVEESRQAVVLAKQYDDMYASVGIHPHEMNTLLGQADYVERIQEWVTALRLLAADDKVVAIGECGLDYYAHDSTKKSTDIEKAIQRHGLLAQLELARELSLPLILHCRTEPGQSDAYEDLLMILAESQTRTVPVILHCYMADTDLTERFLALPHVYFSFTGNISYPVKKAFLGTKNDLTKTVRMIPLGRIFVETDCPFLSPQAMRGERNEPQNVTEVLKVVAQLQGKEVSEVKRHIEENFKTVFPAL